MSHAYTEDQLVEQPAIGLFAELGWQTVLATEEAFENGGILGRETSGDVGAKRAGRCRCAGETGNGGQVVQAGGGRCGNARRKAVETRPDFA